MEKLQGIYKVISNEKLCAKFFRLCIDAKPIVKNARPGQFIHIRLNDGLQPLFRRPFSIYRAKRSIETLYEVVGRGTQLMASWEKGDHVDVLGPVGTPFWVSRRSCSYRIRFVGDAHVRPLHMK
jgi:dihydroorotate dehydrogenase electron transfer subunit